MPTDERNAKPSIDRVLETFKLLFQRVLDGPVVWAYLVMFGLWMLLSSMFVGGILAAMFATGLVGSSSPDVAGPGMLLLLGGGFLVAFCAMIAWQAFMIGLQRPMYALMFQGPDAYENVTDVLRDAASRFFPILGVTFVIGLVVYGGGLAGTSAILLPSVFGVVSVEPSMMILVGYFLIWAVASLATGLFFGPATYFVATRNIGIVAALTKSFSFVKNHLTEHLVAWAGFLAGSLFLGCAGSTGSFVPGLGQLLQFVGSIFAGFVGLAYWASVYMMLEDDADPRRSIVWEE